MYRRSLDGGATFSDTVILGDEVIDTDSQNPAISAEGNNVYVVWSEPGSILVRKSTDGGANFGEPILVSSMTHPAGLADIDMVVVGNVVYLVWSENITNIEQADEIHFSRSVDGGSTFSVKKI